MAGYLYGYQLLSGTVATSTGPTKSSAVGRSSPSLGSVPSAPFTIIAGNAFSGATSGVFVHVPLPVHVKAATALPFGGRPESSA